MIDMDYVDRLIKHGYWDAEPPPPYGPRWTSKPTTRKLKKAEVQAIREQLIRCNDPYLIMWQMRHLYNDALQSILGATITQTASTRSSAFLGKIPGPSRILTFAFCSAISGNPTVRINLRILDQETAVLTNDATTTPILGPWLVSDPAGSRGIPGFAHVQTTQPVMIPVNVYLPNAVNYLYAYATCSSGATHIVLLTWQPIFCSAPAAIGEEDTEGLPPSVHPDFPIEYIMTGPNVSWVPEYYWQYSVGQWTMMRQFRGRTLDYNAVPTRTLTWDPSGTLVPPNYPDAPPTDPWRSPYRVVSEGSTTF